jgi:hypothetical protein
LYAWRKLFDQPPFPEHDPILQPGTAELEEFQEFIEEPNSESPPTSEPAP